MPKVHKSIEIKTTPELFINNVVLDFEKYPEFIDDVRRVKVLKKENDNYTVEFHVRVIKDISYTLNLKKESDTLVKWNLEKGDFMKVNSGHWKVVKKDKNTIVAEYFVEIELPFFVPKSITKALIEKSLPKMLEGFKKRAESMVV